ncbi:DNA topoisomerase IV subunit A [Aerococcus sp. 1KP-2016]|uniref:DNA topoisomerase IV subunit A n=1 Tax=Aerococcus sp. 1KP-2016 TaxID=1981982 RepID=UPI000B993E10|nr:DNA topoisomerase IV subunit A [Aerococcus sp. 1KP-2016]OYQ67831.1 DNA topoisomerase IV subunit A [Aerococcus sp. 1KP-2016]
MVDIQKLTLEEVMGDRFGRYSKYIIQDRALPDIRDGLKPVQRRILFAMFQEGNTSTSNFRKSAKTVGNVIGNYHPHGDSSVYEAMVRMSQDWKNREVLVEMHGNNGSMDGDSAAAMRYTEARLSKIADELLRDLDKDTVEMILNFDDTAEEPTVLPAGYPNLLVNGATGISAGYATEIPPHNLGEIIDATAYLIDHPNASVGKLMDFVPGPDFPTGAIIQGKDELKKAYTSGRGKVVVRSKHHIETDRSGKEKIVITEIPYEVNKANLVRRMDELRLNRSIDGIQEVRDESDRNGLQIVIELKKEASSDAILNYFYKNSDLQINYNFNMVAINHQRPEQIGLKEALLAYIEHRYVIIRRRTTFDLNKAQRRLHIVDGLVKAMSILDEVIAVIRNSKNKSDSKQNLIREFDFSETQAEAIVSLQLYRLTNTDVTALQNERLQLNEEIASYQAILNDDKLLYARMKTELKAIKKAYASERRTEIQDEIEEVIVKKQLLISEEDAIVVVTRGGYIKRSTIRSFKASGVEEVGLRDGDHVLYMAKHTTLEQLVFITSKGNYIFQPVYELQDIRWKDLGEHISQRISFASDEYIIGVFPYAENSKDNLLLATAQGMIKQTGLSEFKEFRGYKNKAGVAMTLSSDTDQVISVYKVDSSTDQTKAQVILTTHFGFTLRYPIEEISIIGARAKGVKSINLKQDDYVISAVYAAEPNDNLQIMMVTQRGHMKRMKWAEINVLGRAKRGLVALKELKANPHRIVAAFSVEDTNQMFEVISSHGKILLLRAGDIPIANRYSNGSMLVDEKENGQITTVTPIIDYQNFQSEN